MTGLHHPDGEENEKYQMGDMHQKERRNSRKYSVLTYVVLVYFTYTYV